MPTIHAIRSALAAYEPQRKSAERQAAVAIVLRQPPGKTSCEALFIRRAEHPEDPWSGHMAFPGGRVDPEDHHPFDAAVRETEEELALGLAQTEPLGRLSSVPVMARGRRLPMTIEPFVFALGIADPTLRMNHEVDEALWIPLAFFSDRDHRETFHWQRDELSARLPCYHWEGRKIWGLTLIIVDELVGLI